MPKRDADHMNAQRERILRAAIGCIGDLGLERTSVAAICKAAGLSVGAVYKHFAGKDEIVAEALRFAAMAEATIPERWPDLRDSIAEVVDEEGFDVTTIARTNLQLLASSMRQGPLRDMLAPLLHRQLALLARRLAAMSDDGQLRLRMSPARTALCMSALADGITWLGWARGRPHDEIAADIAAGLACLVELPDG